MKITGVTPNPNECTVARFYLEDKRAIDILPMTFGKFRVAIGPNDNMWYDDAW